MTDFAIYFERETRAGGFGHGEVKRGECVVDNGDGRCRFYRIPRGERRAFKAWFDNILFASNRKLSGRYPYYYEVDAAD